VALGLVAQVLGVVGMGQHPLRATALATALDLLLDPPLPS
jgi:hypothetical protein